MAAIYRGPEKGYVLDDNDVLWLARAFVGEAGEDCDERDAGALFHCWMDRFHLVRARWNTEGWPFVRLLTAHSQPVNDLWIDPDGEKCRAHPEACTASRIARRKYIQGLTQADLERIGVWDLALAAQDGSLPRTIAEPTYDFAACSLTSKQGRPCPGTNINGNCILTYECLKDGEREDVIPGTVTVEGSVAQQVVTGGAVAGGIGALLLAIGAGVAWLVSRGK